MPDDNRQITEKVLKGLFESILKRVGDRLPRKVSVHELAIYTSAVLRTLSVYNQPGVVTFKGVPSFLLVPLDRDDAQAVLLGASPELAERIRQSEAHLAQELEAASPCPECGGTLKRTGRGPFICTSCGTSTGWGIGGG